MTNIKLFKTTSGDVKEIQGSSVALEKSLQDQIERNLVDFFGVRFLASEYSTGKTHGGRIDTLGIDENGCPVVIEYKKAVNKNVINQGLFYLNWLQDHKGEFELLVLRTLGDKASHEIVWESPRLICIAGDFTKYDEHAVQQMNVNIDLIRYKRFGEDLLLFEHVNSFSSDSDTSTPSPAPGNRNVYKTVGQYLESSGQELKDTYESLKAMLIEFGDDVQIKEMKNYFAFKRLRNFACVEVKPQARKLLAYVKVNPDEVSLEDGFTRDVRSIGHFGTGDLEITMTSTQDVLSAKSLFEMSYENS